MKKRAMFGVGAAAVVVLLAAGSASASDTLDYAMSIGQIDTADTANYVIEATSDGGYVVGGQTVQCFKEVYTYNEDSVRLKIAGIGGYINRPVYGELAPISECEEAGVSDHNYPNYSYKAPSTEETPSVKRLAGDDTRAAGESLLDHYCGDPFEQYGGYGGKSLSAIDSTAPTMKLADYDENAYYNYYCVDYIAKFKQDGTKEWLSLIRNGDMPVAVGETAADYRLLTAYGMLYTFGKTDGGNNNEDGKEIETSRIYDAILNNDGTITTADDYNGIAYYDAEGSYVRQLPMNDTDRYSTGIAPIAKMLIRSGDDLVVVHLKFDENAGPSDGASEAIVEKVSMDLSTTEQLLSYTQEEAYEFGQSIPVSADRDGNILFLTILPDENFENVSLSFMTMNKDGEVIATLSTENLLDINDIGDLYGDPETLPRILDEFTIVTPAKNKLVQLSPQLTEKATYAMAQDEVINDAVALTDGSLAGVGRSYASTANYEINGTVNGTYLRLTAKVSPSGTTNPNTLDDAGMMTIFGATAAVIAAGAVALVSKRR